MEFAEWSATAEEFIDTGDRVVVRTRYTARGEASGAEVEAEYWFVYAIAEGKIVKQDYFVDRSKAFEAAGLSE